MHWRTSAGTRLFTAHLHLPACCLTWVRAGACIWFPVLEWGLSTVVSTGKNECMQGAGSSLQLLSLLLAESYHRHDARSMTIFLCIQMAALKEQHQLDTLLPRWPQVSISKETTIIQGDGSTQQEVNARVKQIRNLAAETEQEYEKEKLNERIARLSGGVAVIQVRRYSLGVSAQAYGWSPLTSHCLLRHGITECNVGFTRTGLYFYCW